jgi:Iap family predicted aminopeptidase
VRKFACHSFRLCAAVVALAAAQTAVRAAESVLTPHELLTQLCDDFGGRLTGSSNNAAALNRLAAQLRAIGVHPEKQSFTMPGWQRGADRVEMTAPLQRPLRVAALSYTQPTTPFEARCVDIGNGRAADYPTGDLSDAVGVLSFGTPVATRDFVATAAERKLRAILFVDREGGGQLLARTGSFLGQPLPLPVFSIAQEEGLWMQRLLARNLPVKVRVETRSRSLPVTTNNLLVRIPGRDPNRIVVGAHFDSWDLGQGAMDNGLGVAQLYALALALRGSTPQHTIELIWFNGEEQGLWGSRAAAEKLGDTPVIAMVNLDMVGVPIGVNALGADDLVATLERWSASLPAERRLPKGVENINWAASDHTPYQLAGVRTITFDAPIPRESVRYYHDFADTIDKVTPKLIDDSAATVLSLVQSLAGDAELKPVRRSPEEILAQFTRFGLENRMRGMGLWPAN